MTVGIAVPTTVASSAARNMPVMTPSVTHSRLCEDIASVGTDSEREWLSIRFGDDTTRRGAAVCPLLGDCGTKESPRTRRGGVWRKPDREGGRTSSTDCAV